MFLGNIDGLRADLSTDDLAFQVVKAVDRRVVFADEMCIRDRFQVPVEQIMAVGDSPNDVDMLKEAGFAVAMDNASPAVKDVVDYVTAGNDDDGVAKVIEKFVL